MSNLAKENFIRTANPELNASLTVGKPLPNVPPGFTMPFYYGSLWNCGVFYLVDPSVVEPYLKNTGLKPAIFHNKAVVSYNFQLYIGEFSAGNNVPPEKWPASGVGVTQELELNIVCYPESQEAHLAQVTFAQFIEGDEQSKILGNHRVHVPCDDDIAIKAGETLFGEPKFKTSFKVNLASINPLRKSGTEYRPEWHTKWGFRVDDPQNPEESIFTAHVNLDGLSHSIPGNFSAITEYGLYEKELIGCRWNILQPMPTYFLKPSESHRVKLEFGTSKHSMVDDMKKLIGNTPPSAVRVFGSQPAAIQSRSFRP